LAELFDECSLSGQPSLCLAGGTKNPDLGEVRPGEDREHSHHAKERVPGGHDSATIEPHLLSDTVNFLRHRVISRVNGSEVVSITSRKRLPILM
jgi:hypothetical protein